MRVIVAGGREFTDREFLFKSLDAFHTQTPIVLLIEGGQRTYDRNLNKCIGGVDFLAHLWAVNNGIATATVHAHWKRFDAAAGPVRNGWMVSLFNVDRLIVFPGNRGTADCIRQAEKAGIPITHMQDLSADPDSPK